MATQSDSNLDGAEKYDYLIYLVNDYPNPQQLMLYDPFTGVHTQILLDWDIGDFNLSIKNQLAFSSRDNDGKIYVLSYPFQEKNLVEIPITTPSSSIALSWSPDGRYLLFYSVQTDNKTLSLWDGKSITNILNYNGTIDEVTWSPDGHLAFTEFYSIDPNTTREWGSSEIFYWDGKAVVSVSQNPSGEDRFPAWSSEGDLAFLSARNGQYDILIWDGVSKNKNVPDSNTFINVAPNLAYGFSNPTWTSSGSLTFGASGKEDTLTQIYEWNGQTVSNISKNPSSHNGGQTWRSDGYWSFITFFSSSQDLYIRDNANQTILKTKGQYPPAWSPEGLLIYCVPGDNEWTLSMWNGKKVVEIVRSGYIAASWKNGEAVFCSYG